MILNFFLKLSVELQDIGYVNLFLGINFLWYFLELLYRLICPFVVHLLFFFTQSTRARLNIRFEPWLSWHILNVCDWWASSISFHRRTTITLFCHCTSSVSFGLASSYWKLLLFKVILVCRLGHHVTILFFQRNSLLSIGRNVRLLWGQLVSHRDLTELLCTICGITWGSIWSLEITTCFLRGLTAPEYRLPNLAKIFV